MDLDTQDNPLADLRTHKIAACRFEYEYLGKSPAELAGQYEFPLASVEEEIHLKSWERKIAPTDMPETKDMQEFADKLEKITRSKLSIISLFRQIDNQPLYAEIEKALLGKILEATTSLDALDDKMANKLVNLAKAVQSIQEREPINLADSFKEALESSSSGVVVNIANMVQ